MVHERRAGEKIEVASEAYASVNYASILDKRRESDSSSLSGSECVTAKDEEQCGSRGSDSNDLDLLERGWSGSSELLVYPRDLRADLEYQTG